MKKKNKQGRKEEGKEKNKREREKATASKGSSRRPQQAWPTILQFAATKSLTHDSRLLHPVVHGRNEHEATDKANSAVFRLDILRFDDVAALEVQTHDGFDLEGREKVVEEHEEVDLVRLEHFALCANHEIVVNGRDTFDELGGHAEFTQLRLDGMRRNRVFHHDWTSLDRDGLGRDIAGASIVWLSIRVKPVGHNEGPRVGEQETSLTGKGL